MVQFEYQYNRFHLNANSINCFARTYTPLLKANQLRNIFNQFNLPYDLELFSNYQLHSLANEILMGYTGELKIKALLVNYFINENVIAAFEIKTNTSRLDFLRVNGTSISYEVKSELDNLNRLSKQMADYKSLFEFNNVVVDEKHLINIYDYLPDSYGILVVNKNKLKFVKKAVLNNKLNHKAQLNLFTKKELKKIFGINDTYEILNTLNGEKINNAFKEMLKERYADKWNFILKNKEAILSSNYQYFFHHNISPKAIYGL